MAVQARGAEHLWLFVPSSQAENVLALNVKFRDVRVSRPQDDLLTVNLPRGGKTALLIGEKCGSYSGIINRGPLISRYSGLNAAEIQTRIAKKNPSWSNTKVQRAAADIVAKEAYNSLTHHHQRDYEHFWKFMCDVVSLCEEVCMIYDDGHDAVPQVVSSVMREPGHVTREPHRIIVSQCDCSALHSIAANELYLFQ